MICTKKNYDLHKKKIMICTRKRKEKNTDRAGSHFNYKQKVDV